VLRRAFMQQKGEPEGKEESRGDSADSPFYNVVGRNTTAPCSMCGMGVPRVAGKSEALSRVQEGGARAR
jgi:hypothetical protein